MTSRTVTEAVGQEPSLHIKKGPSEPRPPITAKITNALRIRNIKLDPARALEPARKKLSTIESQRIMSVFDDCIKRIEIVTSLPYIMKNYDRFRISLGTDLAELIKQHYRIQSTYQEMRTQLDVLLLKRAKQTEYLEARIAAANAAEVASSLPTEHEGEKPYNLFDDTFSEYEEGELHEEHHEDHPGEHHEDHPGEHHEEHHEEGHKVENEKHNEGEALDKVEEESEKEVSEYMGSGGEMHEEMSTMLARTSGAIADRSGAVVSENIGQMIKHGSETEHDEFNQIDYEPRIQEAMRNLGLVAQQVSHSCKNVLRLFMINPTAMAIINCEENMRNEGGQGIINSMMELRDILLQKLLTTPEEEMERAAYLEDISRKERHNQAVIERLEKELNEAVTEKNEGIRINNDIIRRLQTDLHQIEKFSDESIRRTRAEAEKQELSDAKNSDQKIQRFQSEIDTLQMHLNTMITEHRETEGDLRAKKYKVENEVDNWIQKYDQDLGERQDEYEEIDLIYTEEKKQLLELEERFAALEKEYLGIMEERRVAREKRERAQRELNMLVKAATTIQAFWRSYKVRKALAKKKKKQRGKKGKGKGKGKK